MRHSSFEIDYKIRQRKNAIKRALMTPEARLRIERKAHKEYLWTQSLHSTDPEVIKKLFRKEWPQFEKCVDNKEDKQKLKKMFDIK
ncbi:MAG: hypothetical protein WCO48_03300 [Candidatus Taylorbacteria bacterium]